MLKLDLSKDAGKFLEVLPAKQFKQIVQKMFNLLADPEPSDSIDVKGMKGYKRVDIGEYRIAYSVQEDVLKVPVIGKRNDSEIYKKLKNKGI